MKKKSGPKQTLASLEVFQHRRGLRRLGESLDEIFKDFTDFTDEIPISRLAVIIYLFVIHFLLLFWLFSPSS